MVNCVTGLLTARISLYIPSRCNAVNPPESFNPSVPPCVRIWAAESLSKTRTWIAGSLWRRRFARVKPPIPAPLMMICSGVEEDAAVEALFILLLLDDGPQHLCLIPCWIGHQRMIGQNHIAWYGPT